MKFELWKHQQKMSDFASTRRGVIFACVMGGGKTGATIDVLDNQWNANIVLILAPKAVVSSVWPSEIEKFSERPWRVVPCAMSGTPRRIKTIMEKGKEWKDSGRAYPIAFVLNYEALRNDEMFKLLSKIPFDSIVCDECVTGDTLISTPRGDVRADEIKTGDVIYGYDHGAYKRVETTVTDAWVSERTQGLMEIEGATLTVGHEVWTHEHGYIEACRLWSKNIRMVDGDSAFVQETGKDMRGFGFDRRAWMTRYSDRDDSHVYDLTTGTENYFAGGVLVHNCHRTKGPKSKTSKAVAKLVAQRKQIRRIGLTGTLMPHSPMDLYAQMRVINPDVFGRSFYKFKKTYSVMGGFGGKQIVAFKNTDEMMERCRDTIIRVTEEDANLNLPEMRDEYIQLGMCTKAMKVYKDLELEMVAQVMDGEITAQNGLVKLLRLAQLASGFAVIDTLDDLGDVIERRVEVIDTAKFDYLKDLFEDAGDRPTICFCAFRPEMDMVHRAAKAAGVGSLEVSGRVIELDQWQNGDAPVIVSQIEAGSEGVNLTRSAHCVFVSVGMKAGKYQQARKRAHRPGQKTNVLNTHLVCTGTVDETNISSIQGKISLVEGVLNRLREMACE